MLKNFLFFFFSFNILFADINNKIDISLLSKNSQWLRLLYFDVDQNISEIISDDYFLSKHGKVDPLAELEKTIELYEIPFGKDPNEHPRCRFPARYKWLSSKIDLKNYEVIPAECERLAKSYNDTKFNSISLMFVTGYLGNPASSFGHSFFKLNDNLSSSTDLFDVSISYGAEIPKDENIIAYIYNGLFGNYSATFSDQYFYSHDMVYSGHELRDIWEYELNLSEQQIVFFKLHLWEILNKKFQYLFLTKNCGYEVTKILEVILNMNLIYGADFWFIPIETFHIMHDEHEEIIKDIIFHPSEQRKINKKFESLTQKEKAIVMHTLRNHLNDYSFKSSNLDQQEHINIIDFLINYYNYLEKEEHDIQNLQQLKKEVLLERFNLAPKKEKIIDFVDISAPTQSHKPSVFYTNFNMFDKRKNFLSLGFTPYSINRLDKNNFEGDEFVILDGELGINEKEIFLNKLNLVSVKRFNQNELPFKAKRSFSWQADITIQRLVDSNKYNVYIEGGVGNSWKLNNNILLSGMINGSAHSYASNIRLTPEISTRLIFKDYRMIINYKNNIYEKEKVSKYSLEVLSHIDVLNDKTLYFKYNHSEQFGMSISSGLKFYF